MDADMLVREDHFDPEHIELNGSRFVLANGYMGYRGTLDEYTREELVACTLAGLYDRRGDAWREPVNAPNGLLTRLYCDGQPLSVLTTPPSAHTQALDLGSALHERTSVFTVDGNSIRLTSQRFLSLDDVHLAAMEYRLQVERACRVTIETGIDADLWEMNGPHLASLRAACEGEHLVVRAETNEGERLVVNELLDTHQRRDAVQQHDVSTGDRSIIHRIAFDAEAGARYCFHKFVSIYTSKDGVDDLAAAALDSAVRARQTGYARLQLQHARLWHERWRRADVRIDGDPEAEAALRYSLFQLMQVAPAHTDAASIPARGLSGQMYKGAIFWDTELFMLPFFIYIHPEVARHLVRYRCHTLNGARAKATEYGYRGAFYAWESQERGDDACTLFGVTDVFTGRPIRTYFRDKQIHISADVAYGIWQYFLITGDESILFEGGAEALVECARFFCSYAYFKKDKQRYELLDVTGPDEYHERVANNAYTNAMARFTIEVALRALAILEQSDEAFFRQLRDRLGLEEAIAELQEVHDLLFVPAPDAETLVVEQFDGYRRLEDVPLAALKARVIKPNEYLGGGNGLATTTQVLKQADVVAMMHVFRARYATAVKEANWAYYEPRTEQGSTLSAALYALVAADTYRPDRAYPYFMTAATVDVRGDYKRYVGTLYMGGTHPGASGGAWMAAILGFAGLDFDGSVVTLRPALPAHWQRLGFRFTVKGQDFRVEIAGDHVDIQASADNAAACDFDVAGQRARCAPGEQISVAVERR